MKAIVLAAPGRLEMREVPTPEPGAGEVLVRTAACGICATDLAMIDGNPRAKPPAILGHEWSGVIEAVGEGVDKRLAGRPCVAENILADGGEVGFEHPGGYGQFLVTAAANVQVLPDGFDMAAAALIEPLAVCVRAMRRLSLSDNRAAVVFGDGPMGLLMLLLLNRAGVKDVSLIGGRPGRLALARELGANVTVNYHDLSGDLSAAVRGRLAAGSARATRPSPLQPIRMTLVAQPPPAVPARPRAGVPHTAYSDRLLQSGAPTVIEASGSSAAMRAALGLAAPCARVLVIGDYGDARADFPWNDLLHRELTLVGSNASAGAWPDAVRLAADGSVPLARLVSRRLPAERFAEGIDLVRSRSADIVKVVMEW